MDPGGPELELALSGATALRLLARRENTALVVEDALGDMRGVEVLKRARQQPETSKKPVIVVSQRDQEIDRVLAFELGADDFVSKPVNPRELALRVQAVLRRVRQIADAPPERVAVGPLSIDIAGHEVTLHGERLPLTVLEFRLLADLARHRGRVRSREDLLQSVWNHSGDVETRTVDTHIKRLREKLNSLSSWIETVRGVGYRLRDEH